MREIKEFKKNIPIVNYLNKHAKAGSIILWEMSRYIKLDDGWCDMYGFYYDDKLFEIIAEYYIEKKINPTLYLPDNENIEQMINISRCALDKKWDDYIYGGSND